MTPTRRCLTCAAFLASDNPGDICSPCARRQAADDTRTLVAAARRRGLTLDSLLCGTAVYQRRARNYTMWELDRDGVPVEAITRMFAVAPWNVNESIARAQRAINRKQAA